MSGQSKNGNSVAHIPRRSARGKTLRETTATSEPQAEDVNSATSKGPSQPHRLRKSEVLSSEVDVHQLEDNNPRRSGRKNPNRLSVRTQSSSCLTEDPLRFITTPTTLSDLEAWKGWCEVESEPAFFNVILRHLGVDGIKVQEVFSLDDEMLNFLPKPIHGLIFLFQFKEDDPAMQEATCPDNIWFANQTTSNACASIALLNIVMNIRGIDLGPTLESLKDFSMPLTPSLRGYAVGNHDYLRKVHNSFSRKMDMLNADLFLSNDVAAKSVKAKVPGKKGAKVDHEQAGFHFISFIPIDGSLWKLDGLERQPMNLGEYDGDDWMDLARPIIAKRMHHYEDDQIQFSLLALCQSPLLTVHNDLSQNICTIAAVENHLEIIQPDWRNFVDGQDFDNILTGPDPSYRVTSQSLEAASVSPTVLREIQNSSVEVENLLHLRKQLSDSQGQMRASFIDEATAIQQDDERAATRHHDYTAMINAWLVALANKRALKDLVNDVSQGHFRE